MNQSQQQPSFSGAALNAYPSVNVRMCTVHCLQARVEPTELQVVVCGLVWVQGTEPWSSRGVARAHYFQGNSPASGTGQTE